MKRSHTTSIVQILLITTSMNLNGQNIEHNKEKLEYPKFQTSNFEEIYYTKVVKDPFRQLENIKNPATKKWYDDQKLFFEKVMHGISGRAQLKADIENYLYASNVKCGLPRESNVGVFYIKSFLKENYQTIAFIGSNKEEIEIFSTKELNTSNKYFHIDYIEPSYSGNYIAFGISLGGDEMSTLKVLNITTKQILSDSIQWAMYGNPQWLPDETGFFYNQLNRTEDDISFEESKVRIHLMGTTPSADRTVFSKELNKDLLLTPIDFPVIYVNPTSDKAIAVVWEGSSPYVSIYACDYPDLVSTQAANKWTTICNSQENVGEFALCGDDVYIISYKDNPYGNLEKRNATNPKNRKQILEGNQIVLGSLIHNKNSLFLKGLKNGVDQLIRVPIDNQNSIVIDTPVQGSIQLRSSGGLQSEYLHSENLFFKTCSWTTDWAIYQYQSNNKQIVKTDIIPENKFSKTSNLIVKEVEVPSHDGTQVPLTIIFSDNITLNGKNPTILYGYGAYGISKSPTFNYSLLSWFARGGIYAVAHVRGGGEKGDRWYKGGYKSTKPNSWKDFIACAEYLIHNNYTSTTLLAAEGASAGGITVGRAITDRPDLFKAAVINYGAVNSLRDEFTSNTLGKSEFGTIKDSTEFNYLYEMDVYQHIKQNVIYPSTLFTAGMNDSRVAFWQPAKAAAKMQSGLKSKNIVLLRISDEGHFGQSSIADDLTDKYSFILWQIGDKHFTPISK